MRCIVGLVLVAGCTDPHVLDVSWSIARSDPSTPLLTACPIGWTTVHFVAVDPADPDHPHVDTFDCNAGSGTSEYLPANHYQGRIEVTDEHGKVLATSLPDTVDATGFTPYFSAQILIDAGFVRASYAFANLAECQSDDVGAMHLALAQPGGLPFAETYESCAPGTIVSPSVPPGDYTATLFYAGQTIATVDDVSVSAPNRASELGPYTIP